MSLREANLWFLAFLEVRESIFSTFSGPIRILAQKSTKIAQLQLGMCLLTHFMAKTVLPKTERSAIFGLWPFWRGASKFFPLFWSHMNPGTKILQNIQITAWKVPPNSRWWSESCFKNNKILDTSYSYTKLKVYFSKISAESGNV